MSLHDQYIDGRHIVYDRNARRWVWEDTMEYLDSEVEAAHFAERAATSETGEQTEEPARRRRS